MRTPAIALLTTLAAFAAYRQQADGSTRPIEDLESTDAEETASRFDFETASLTPQGTVALPETQPPQDLSQARSRLSETTTSSSSQIGLGRSRRMGLSQLTAQINASIAQTRSERLNQGDLGSLGGPSLAGQAQPFAVPPVAPTVTLSALPSPPLVLPAPPIHVHVNNANPGVRSYSTPQSAAALQTPQAAGYPTDHHSNPRNYPSNPSAAALQTPQATGYPVHQPETGSKQPQFSGQAIAAATPSQLNAVPSRQAADSLSAKPQDSPAIAAQVPETTLATEPETTPAMAGQYHFSDRLQVQPIDALTVSAPQGLAPPVSASLVTANHEAACALQPTASEPAPDLNLLLAAETATLAAQQAKEVIQSANPSQPDASAPTREANLSNSTVVCEDDTNVLAQRMPEAATAGTPIPGIVLSPTL